MKRSNKESTRKAAALPENLNRRLGAYALAAGAAGVGVLALAQPAEASIISARENIVIDSSHRDETLTIAGSYKLRFNLFSMSGEIIGKAITVQGLGGVGVEVPNGSRSPLMLPRGSKIATGTLSFPAGGMHFGGGGPMAGSCAPVTCGGNWRVDGQKGYLGFVLGSRGSGLGAGGRFGWVKMSFSSPPGGFNLTGHLTEYAYDTVPGQAIFAGQTSAPEPGTPTLLLLALGALGLSALRGRKRSAVSSQPPANA